MAIGAVNGLLRDGRVLLGQAAQTIHDFRATGEVDSVALREAVDGGMRHTAAADALSRFSLERPRVAGVPTHNFIPTEGSMAAEDALGNQIGEALVIGHSANPNPIVSLAKAAEIESVQAKTALERARGLPNGRGVEESRRIASEARTHAAASSRVLDELMRRSDTREITRRAGGLERNRNIAQEAAALLQASS
jgi:hypothetical protein